MGDTAAERERERERGSLPIVTAAAAGRGLPQLGPTKAPGPEATKTSGKPMIDRWRHIQAYNENIVMLFIL